jgi:hypothetical protein
VEVGFKHSCAQNKITDPIYVKSWNDDAEESNVWMYMGGAQNRFGCFCVKLHFPIPRKTVLRLHQNAQAGCEAHPFFRRQRCRYAILITHLQLKPRLKMSGAIQCTPPAICLHCVKRDNFIFSNICDTKSDIQPAFRSSQMGPHTAIHIAVDLNRPWTSRWLDRWV